MGVSSVKKLALGCLLVNVLVGISLAERPQAITTTHGEEIETPYCQFIQTCVSASATVQAQFIESPPQTDRSSQIRTA